MERKTLTPELQRAMEQLSPRRKNTIVEIRFRIGSQVKGVYPWGEELLTENGSPISVTEKLLQELLDRATGFSPYALRLEETGLYLPLEGGWRMGLCGEAVVQGGKLQGLRHITSLVIRMARQCRGAAEKTAEQLTKYGKVQSALIVSPPGHGKTTFLRDLIRCVSERGYRVSVVDERRELAAAVNGVPQMDLGPSTDVLTGCPKAQAMELLIRVMNPQVLAVDELSGPQELRMAKEAASCGIALFATAHADSIATLRQRPGFRQFLDSGVIDWGIVLRDYKTVQMERLGQYAEDCGSVLCGGSVYDGGMGVKTGAASATAAAAATAAGAGTDARRNGTAYALCGRAL